MEEQNLDYQKVGEMFVMQYYTQMHKDPSQMYKFYQDSSTFVHGGSEMGKGELIMGKTVSSTLRSFVCDIVIVFGQYHQRDLYNVIKSC